MKFSVIMPSYLSDYEGSATNRVTKFYRAITSIANQTHDDKELVIVSDGCEITNRIYDTELDGFGWIKIVKLSKQPLFSGYVRSEGIKSASGDAIAYLDSDDQFGENHLTLLNVSYLLDKSDWLIFNDKVSTGRAFLFNERTAQFKLGSIGTSNISHLSKIGVDWIGCDGYGHDFKFIQKLKSLNSNVSKGMGDYRVMHVRNLLDY